MSLKRHMYKVALASLGLCLSLMTLGCPRVQPAPEGVGTANYPPVAMLFFEEGGAKGEPIKLDGSRSYDPNPADTLGYTWSLDQSPTGSSAQLQVDADTGSFTPDLDGRYLVTLQVSDGVYQDQSTVAIEVGRVAPGNRSPVAVIQGSLIESTEAAALPFAFPLIGSASTDADGDPLSFAWSVTTVSGPGTASVDVPGNPNVAVSVTDFGIYTVALEVSDGQATNTATETLTLSPATNLAPSASISAPASVEIGTAAAFDGSASSDPELAILSYTWTLSGQPAGSSASLPASGVTVELTPDVVGNYEVSLVVNDGSQDSVAATKTLLATDPAINNPPVAAAAGPSLVLPGSVVTLDGSASIDPDGDTLNFAWTLDTVPSGSGASLSGQATVSPSFQADFAGTYALTLTVDDGVLQSTDTVQIVADAAPNAVIASLPSQVLVGASVQLNGSGSSDPDGSALSYQWTLLPPAGSSASLSPTDTAMSPSFSADAAGTYTVRLVVNDGSWDSAPVSATLIAGSSVTNGAPIASAGPDQLGFPVNTEVQLDGSASSDPDANPLLYSWSFVSVPLGSKVPLLNGRGVSTPTFVPLEVGSYTLALVVDDGRLRSAPDTVTITAQNLAPVADPGPDFVGPVTDLLTVDGSASSDPNNDPLSYFWTLLSSPVGSSALVIGRRAESASFFADLAGDYVLQLVVNDGSLASPAVTVTVSASADAPIANPGAELGVSPGTLVALDGSASVDPRPVPGPLSYQWTLVGYPGTTAPVLSNANSATPTFTPMDRGYYTLSLVVQNALGMASAPATVDVIAKTSPSVEAGQDFKSMLANDLYSPRQDTYLYATPSVDSLARPYSVTWTMLSAPAGSVYEGVRVVPRFDYWNMMADLPGHYVVQCTLIDAFGDQASDVVSFDAEAPTLQVVAGAGSSAVVGSRLATPLQIKMSSLSGLSPGPGQALLVRAPGLAPVNVLTDGQGIAVASSLVIGSTVGPQTIEIWSADYPAAKTTATVMGTHGPAVGVILEPPVDTSVDNLMLLRGRVVDASMNTVTDSTLQGTLVCNAGAGFGAVVTGTEVSRADAQHVVFQVAAGVVEIEVSDLVAETVDFSFVDSSGLGLIALGRQTLMRDGFETSGGGLATISANWSVNTPPGEWAWGQPTNVGPTPHGGAAAWGTNLGADYSVPSESVMEIAVDLTGVPSVPQGGNVALLHVWHWEALTNTLCGGPAVDGDSNTGALAFVGMDVRGGNDIWDDILIPVGGTPGGGYDNTQDFNLAASWRPSLVQGWSCSSGGWREAIFDLTPYAGTDFDVQFYLVAQSLGVTAQPGAGFYLDDLWIETLGTGVSGVFLPGAPASVVITGASPGPVGGNTTVTLEVQDQYGQVVSTDNSSSFTVQLTGSATSLSAFEGSALSGLGSGTTVVQATAGRVSLYLTDSVREQVDISLGTPTPTTLDVSSTATTYFTNPAAALCLRGGDAQTGDAGTLLPTPLQVQLIDEIDCGSATAFGTGGTLNFTLTSTGDSRLSSATVVTDSLGNAANSLTLRTTPGVASVSAVSALDAGLVINFTATAVVGPAAKLVVLDPPSVMVPASTTITAEVQDGFGNLVATDSSSTFRLRSEGSILFGTVLAGAQVSGFGNDIIAQVAAGRFQIEASSNLEGYFAVWTEDSLGTGLQMAPRGYEQHHYDVPFACDGEAPSAISFSGVPVAPSGAATLSVISDADINSASEYWNVTMEGAPPVDLGTIFQMQAGACFAGWDTETVTPTVAETANAAADGTIDFFLSPNGVSCVHGGYCSFDTDMVEASLRIPGAIVHVVNNNACGSARPLGRGTLRWRGTTRGASDNFATGCSGSVYTGPDAIFSFLPTTSNSPDIQVIPLDGQNLTFSLFSDCANITAACAIQRNSAGAGGAEIYTWAGVTPNIPYYIVVDTPDGSSGDFEIQAEFQ